MLKGRELLSLPVITLEEKKFLGEVKDLIYNPFNGEILGVIIENAGWFKEAKGFLYKEIIEFNDDGLVVADDSVVRSLSQIPELKDVPLQDIDIRGFIVEDCQGQSIGVVQDLVFSKETGKITGYEISDGVLQDLLNGRTTISNNNISIEKEK